MTSREAKALVGRRIVAVELNASMEGDHPYRRRMHSPTVTLDDGSVLRFVVEEHPEGGEYGVDIVRSMPRADRDGMQQLAGHVQADYDALAAAVTVDMPTASVAERMREAMKRSRGAMHPKLVLDALEALASGADAGGRAAPR